MWSVRSLFPIYQTENGLNSWPQRQQSSRRRPEDTKPIKGFEPCRTQHAQIRTTVAGARSKEFREISWAACSPSSKANRSPPSSTQIPIESSQIEAAQSILILKCVGCAKLVKETGLPSRGNQSPSTPSEQKPNPRVSHKLEPISRRYLISMKYW